MTVHPLVNNVHREKWCTAVGTGGLWLTGGVPILQDFYTAYQRIGCMRSSKMFEDPTFATGMKLMSKGMACYHSEPTAWARVQVFEAWGITPDEQCAMEAHMREFTLGIASPLDNHDCYTPLLTTVLP